MNHLIPLVPWIFCAIGFFLVAGMIFWWAVLDSKDSKAERELEDMSVKEFERRLKKALDNFPGEDWFLEDSDQEKS